MKTTDLYVAIKELGPQKSFFLTDHDDELDYHVLKYNKKNKLWDYYFFNERGGKSQFKIFNSEEEACEYVLNDAIRAIRVFGDSKLDAVRMKYMGLIDSDSDNLKDLVAKGIIQRQGIIMKISDLFEAIKELGPQKSFYFSDSDKIDHYVLKYNERDKRWEYYFFNERCDKNSLKTFDTEEKACEYVLLDAIRIIKDLRNAHMDVVRNKYLG